MVPSLRLSCGVLLVALLALAQAGRNLWLFRKHVQQQQEERAMKEAHSRWQQQTQRPAVPGWIPALVGTIPQPLDHFDWQHRRIFNQRFWINEGYWQRPVGPVFLYIGGESALSQSSVLSGHHVELAEKHSALLVALEHRFYGTSLNHDGLQDQNLQFLSSQQALSDLVAFHHFINQKYSLGANHTWICFGGSYPGSLAAWLRLKFPHLVFAAVASSAPVRAQLDFTGYNQVVAASLSNPVVGGSKECLQMVREAFSAVESLLGARQLGKLATDFHSCRALRGERDCQMLVSNLADFFMGAVQYNNIYLTWGSVASVCGIMTNSSIGSPYQRLLLVNKIFTASLGLLCVDNTYEDLLKELQDTRIEGSQGMRQWYFQTCTEFGYYQTCEDPVCPFSRLMNLTFQLDICGQVFNISSRDVGEAVTFTNDYYGADHPKASRVLFVNGDIDPWHALSVLKNESISELAILINGTAHCANMYTSQPTDPLPLVQARQQISFWLDKWLNLAKIH
ncbi:thymus-specific serine protease [Candoia aspera]|uniref:thymus-specific serine protease n=1 Tax=Candoia aspera TaxID=51853 RepID=UPI002FD7FF84